MRPILAGTIAAVIAGAAQAVPARFVGCPVDGQQGRQAPPPRGPTPDLPPEAARKLVYYATADGGVLAPPHWFCLATAGSNGTSILVARHPIGLRTALLGRPLRGAAVLLRHTSGSTSGRFEVAAVAARVFPAARAFVSRVEGEGLTGHGFPRGPFPTDSLSYAGPYRLTYTTGALRQGIGTRSPLVPGPLPIDGAEWLQPDGGMDLTSIAVRLPKSDRALAAEIIRQATPPYAR